MATLFGAKIKDTYVGLLKLIDNLGLTSTEKEITDGEGVGSGVFLKNDGEIKASKVTSTVEINNNGSYRDSAGALGTAGQVLSTTGTTTAWVDGTVNTVDSVNGATGVVNLDTGDITESGNLYYTDARVNSNSNVIANTAKVGVISGTTAGDMEYWNGNDWAVVATTVNEGATLQMISGVPTWIGGIAPSPFITTWRTTTANEVITIPTTGAGYNYEIVTSDGQTFSNVAGDQAITFAVAGDYDVSISGDFPRIYVNNGVDKTKLIDIKQWGSIVWSSFERSFLFCTNLVTSFTDVPNLSNVTSMLYMFPYTQFNSPINDWDVSNVQNMGGLFDHTPFNQDLSNWDMGSATNINSMFQWAASFDQNLGNWNISNITDMSYAFVRASISTLNYDSILIGWEQTLQTYFPAGVGYTPVLTPNFGFSKYTLGGTAESARTSLINTFGWTITDGGGI